MHTLRLLICGCTLVTLLIPASLRAQARPCQLVGSANTAAMDLVNLDRMAYWSPPLRTRELAELYQCYTQELHGVLQEGEPATLAAQYQDWTKSKRLELVQRLILLHGAGETPADATLAWQVPAFFAEVNALLQRSQSHPEGTLESQLRTVEAHAWQLRFIAAAPGAMEHIAATDAQLRSLQGALALEREVESIETILKQQIASGLPSADLAQRIAALPPDRQNEIKEFRKHEQAAKDRQDQIIEAIRLRREEIDTGKANPRADEQRGKDSELKRAVDEWETAYRQELAEKQAEEERAKEAAEESARVERQQVRKQQELEREIQDLERKYNVRELVAAFQFSSNPYRYEGMNIVLLDLYYKRMLDSHVAVFDDGMGREIIISGVPNDMFGGWRLDNLIVKVQGQTTATNAFGGRIRVPHATFLANFPYSVK